MEGIVQNGAMGGVRGSGGDGHFHRFVIIICID